MKRDENEPEIINALESCGCTVYQLDRPVDLLVGRGKTNILIEVKNPNKPRGDRKLTPAQKLFFASWSGQVAKVETAEQAIDVVTQAAQKNKI